MVFCIQKLLVVSLPKSNSIPPYSGNLYGTPGMNYPAYYGPYYTGYGGYANVYGQPGYGGVPANPGIIMPGTEVEESSAGQTQTDESKTKTGGETLPAPK